MVKNILEMLKLSTHYGQSEAIEIAKGKYAIKKGLKEKIEQHRRKAKFIGKDGN